MNEPVRTSEPAAPASLSWSYYGVQLSARIIAAANEKRGGDWCEAFVVGDGVVALSIGDVCGHGKGKYDLEYSAYDLPLGIEDTHVPALHVVDLAEGSLIVLYSDGVTEHDRRPLEGEAELRDAALFAYNVNAIPPAAIIEQRMHLGRSNGDDVALLTALTPRTFRASAAQKRASAHAF